MGQKVAVHSFEKISLLCRLGSGCSVVTVLIFEGFDSFFFLNFFNVEFF